MKKKNSNRISQIGTNFNCYHPNKNKYNYRTYLHKTGTQPVIAPLFKKGHFPPQAELLMNPNPHLSLKTLKSWKSTPGN